MIITMSGTRADNRPWPPYHGEIEVDEWEAEALVRGQHAEYADTPAVHRGYAMLTVPDPEIEEKIRQRSHEEEFGEAEPVYRDELDEPADDDDFDRRDDDSDFDRDEVVTDKVKPMKRPVSTDAKAEWVKWAVQNGAEEKHSLEMTKAQLVAKFGKL